MQRLHITRYLCGNPLFHNKLKIGVDSSGWPKALLFLKDLSNGTLSQKKFLMTVVTISRSFTLNSEEKKKIKPDYESITKPGKVQKIIPTGFIKEFIIKITLRVIFPTLKRKIFIFPTRLVLSVKQRFSQCITSTLIVMI